MQIKLQKEEKGVNTAKNATTNEIQNDQKQSQAPPPTIQPQTNDANHSNKQWQKFQLGERKTSTPPGNNNEIQ